MRSALRSLALGLALACGGDGLDAPAAGGEAVVRLDTSMPDDGALLIIVSGGPVDSVTAPPGLTVFAAPGPAATTVLVTGRITDGPILLLHLPDLSRARSYSAVVTQAAARVSYALRAPEQYRLFMP